MRQAGNQADLVIFISAVDVIWQYDINEVDGGEFGSNNHALSSDILNGLADIESNNLITVLFEHLDQESKYTWRNFPAFLL